MQIILRQSKVLRAICLFFILGIFFSCAPKKEIEPERELVKKSLQVKAEEAWQEMDCSRVLRFSRELIKRRELENEDRLKHWKRIVGCAMQKKRYNLAGQGLYQWKRLVPEARQSWQWVSFKARLLKETDDLQGYKQVLEEFALNREIPFLKRQKAVEKIFKFYALNADYLKGMGFLAKVYQGLEYAQKKVLIKDVESILQGFSNRVLKELDKEAGGKDLKAFPENFLNWHIYIKKLQDREISWPEASISLKRILHGSKGVLENYFAAKLQALLAEHGSPYLGIALLLPLQGSYSEYSWKIVKGADVGAYQLNQKGWQVSLQVINTLAKDWKQSLRDLPQNYKIVGGMIQEKTWRKIASNSTLRKKRTFFSFRSRLGQGQEGKIGYRFFPGLKDQVRALQDFLQSLELSKLAVLYPQSEYGRRMGAYFGKGLGDWGAELTGLQEYPCAEPGKWRNIVKEFLQVEEKPGSDPENQEYKKPDPDFQAVFIPDSFGQARRMIPEFFYFREDSLVFLGPIIWFEEIEDIAEIDKHYFRLTLVPSAWRDDNESTGSLALKTGLLETMQGKADFWVGLGYDFLRFGAEFCLAELENSPEEINTFLSEFSGFNWSVAQMYWDMQGIAHEDLEVMQIQGQDLVPADLDGFKRRLEWIRK